MGAERVAGSIKELESASLDGADVIEVTVEPDVVAVSVVVQTGVSVVTRPLAAKEPMAGVIAKYVKAAITRVFQFI